MRVSHLSACAAACLVVTMAASAAAQTLADVAKKEEERRKQTPSSGKVYTNKDLGSVPASSAAPSDPATVDPNAPKEAEKPAADKAAADKTATDKASADKAAAADKGAAAKDQKYWKDRIAAAQLALERDSGYAEAMQTRVNALTTDFVNRDDPAQRSVIERNRTQALAELERLKKQILEDKKAIADIEEEARRAGVPPGWLR